MHRLAAAILLVSIIGQTFNQWIYYVDYAIDRAAYEKNCINKYRPRLQCNGKCQLMKKIEEQEKRERQQAPEMKLAGKAEIVSSKSSFLLQIPATFAATHRNYFITNTGSPVDQPSSHFHPPNA